MGAFSTLSITRSKARLVLMERLMTAPDVLLSTLMDEVMRDSLYNIDIVNDDDVNDDDRLPQ